MLIYLLAQLPLVADHCWSRFYPSAPVRQGDGSGMLSTHTACTTRVRVASIPPAAAACGEEKRQEHYVDVLFHYHYSYIPVLLSGIGVCACFINVRTM